jgi:hypothetical protein
VQFIKSVFNFLYNNVNEIWIFIALMAIGIGITIKIRNDKRDRDFYEAMNKEQQEKNDKL